jgi:hypothetical protein
MTARSLERVRPGPNHSRDGRGALVIRNTVDQFAVRNAGAQCNRGEEFRLVLIFDLDGVVYLGDTPIPGAIESLNALAAQGHSLY